MFWGSYNPQKKNILESLTKMQTLEDERNRMYATAKGGSASKKRRQKENRIKEKKNAKLSVLKTIEAWVFYLIPQKQGGWSHFLSFQYSTK